MDRTFKHLRLNNVLWIVLLLGNMEKVDGGISISPAVPAMGAVGDAVFTCDSSGLQFDSISYMQISRKRATETDFTLLASIFRTAVAPGISPNVPFFNSGTDLNTRDGISLSGEGIQTDTTMVSSLELNIQQVNLLCTDEGEYECRVSYLIPSLSSERDKSYTNMTIFGGSTMTTATDSTGGSTMITPTDSTVACASEVDRLKTTAIIIGVVEAVIIVGLTAVVVFLLTRSNTSGQGNSDTRRTELSNY